MIRPALPSDTPLLVSLAENTKVFKPHEIEALQEVLDDYHAVNQEYGHQAAVWLEAEQVAGFVYFAPTAMTDRTWELWWIAVDQERHGKGIGGRLLEYVECEVRRQSGRILLIETSSTPPYVPTRGFYLKHQYKIAAEIPDFYSDGDAKVIFSKKMLPIVA